MDRTEKQRAFIIHFLYFVIVAGLIWIFLRYVIYEIMPFLIGFAIAFLLQPLIRMLARKSGGHERIWAVLTVIIFYMTIGAGLAVLFYQGAQFAADLFRQLPTLYQTYIQPLLQTLSDSLQALAGFLPFDDFSDVFTQLASSLDSVISSVSGYLVSLLGQVTMGVPSFLVSFFFAIISSFFIAMDYGKITRFLLLQLNEKRYFIWSGWDGDTNIAQHLFIAEMDTPWSLRGERVKISSPTYDWEKVGTPYVNEGPAVLQRDGRTYLAYSASGSWTDDYCIAFLELTGEDPMQPESWRKLMLPAMRKSETVFGPGHCSFTVSPDGTQDWMLYHANLESGTGWAGRRGWAVPVRWSADGRPQLGEPAEPGSVWQVG